MSDAIIYIADDGYRRKRDDKTEGYGHSFSKNAPVAADRDSARVGGFVVFARLFDDRSI